MATHRVRLCSVTLCQHSDGSELEALRSALQHVDRCLVLDTNREPHDFPEARELCGLAIEVVRFGPIETSVDPFNRVRERALQVAADRGYDWALMLDCDERLHVGPGGDLRELLATTEADAISIAARGGSYAKEKLFRLPLTGQWLLPSHEVYDCGGRVAGVPWLTFSEIPKTEAQLAARREAVKGLLGAYVQQTPAPPALSRAWQMLGQEAIGAQDWSEAIRCIEQALLTGPSRQCHGWLRYLLASLLIETGKAEQALKVACSGLLHTPWMPELHFACAQAWAALGEHYNAIACCNCAVALGRFKGSGGSITRVGHFDEVAMYEGPFELLAAIMREVGDPDEAARLDSLAAAAKAARLI